MVLLLLNSDQWGHLDFLQQSKTMLKFCSQVTTLMQQEASISVLCGLETIVE